VKEQKKGKRCGESLEKTGKAISGESLRLFSKNSFSPKNRLESEPLRLHLGPNLHKGGGLKGKEIRTEYPVRLGGLQRKIGV